MEADEAGQVGALELVSTIGFEGIRARVVICVQRFSNPGSLS